MLSPAWARAATVMNWAAWPDAAATAATPPSRAAMRFSKTSTVGWREGGRDVSENAGEGFVQGKELWWG